ncbi:MAG: phosphogluconate dehydratase, partial [Gaiellaceae bacterium]|nr:phosphogluconate dehydratase [Gaiellaceae bacterium]
MSTRTGDARSVYGQHMDATVAAVTERVVERSRDERAAYLDRVRRAKSEGPQRRTLSCGNLAHG